MTSISAPLLPRFAVACHRAIDRNDVNRHYYARFLLLPLSWCSTSLPLQRIHPVLARLLLPLQIGSGSVSTCSLIPSLHTMDRLSSKRNFLSILDLRPQLPCFILVVLHQARCMHVGTKLTVRQMEPSQLYLMCLFNLWRKRFSFFYLYTELTNKSKFPFVNFISRWISKQVLYLFQNWNN